VLCAAPDTWASNFDRDNAALSPERLDGDAGDSLTDTPAPRLSSHTAVNGSPTRWYRERTAVAKPSLT
jgi:hypothetical protein